MTSPDPVLAQALRRFRTEYDRVGALGQADPSVVALATADNSGRPSVRMVNLRDVRDDGFVFFANRESGKGIQLATNPRAALCFYWSWTNHQVLIEGSVEQLPEEASNRYWRSRPRAKQIASWASQQSRPLRDRGALSARYREYHALFDEGPVPRPPYWIGYLVVPDRIEFWRADWRRLQGRVAYTRTERGWRKHALNP
jgi:pyridoxamine 5'-phosphate oxidase